MGMLLSGRKLALSLLRCHNELTTLSQWAYHTVTMSLPRCHIELTTLSHWAKSKCGRLNSNLWETVFDRPAARYAQTDKRLQTLFTLSFPRCHNELSTPSRW